MGEQPQFRDDPLTGRRVLIAPLRGRRPVGERACPFCEGNEHETPGELTADRPPGSEPNRAGWRHRVVRNRYGALQADADPDSRGLGKPGVGTAEVFVESNDHETRFESLPGDAIQRAVRSWRDRIRHHRASGRYRHIQVFKNQGESAGASLDHVHSQLMAVEFVPDVIADESHRLRTGTPCPICGPVDPQRLLAESRRFRAVCPIAPRVGYECRIEPKSHSADFGDTSDDAIEDVSRLLAATLRQVVTAARTSAYNLLIMSSPVGESEYHWRIEILPRSNGFAGWEWATGIAIHAVTPEVAAADIRNARPS